MPFREDFTPVALKDTAVFSPVKVGPVSLEHRVVLAPLTRYRAHDNVPDVDLYTEYYSQRTSRPGTLAITEATYITPGAGIFAKIPGIWNEAQIEAWSKVFDVIHANKSFVFQQLWALGWQGFPKELKDLGLKYVGATEGVYMDEESKKLALSVGNPIHGLTKDEIKQYVKDYVQAAKNSFKAGADGVELHSANGYLPNQFLDPRSNQRTDEYGGSIENRARFTLEVVDALIEAVGAQKVGIRLSPFGEYGGMSGIKNTNYMAQFAYVIGELERRGQEGNRLAYIHIVEPRVPNLRIPEGEYVLENCSSEFIYSIWNGVVIRAGDYALHPELAAEHTKKAQTLVAYGRFYISNPDLPDRLYHGYPLNAYDRNTFYTPGAVGYTDLPTYEQAIKAKV